MLKLRRETNGHDDQLREAHTELARSDASIDMLYERLADLELALEDEGWTRLGWEGEREFSRDGLKRICALSRLMYLKNPLIQRAVNVKSYYVWGQGVTVKAREDAIDEVVQRFLDDPGNRDEVFGHAARMGKEVELGTEGNVFFVLFPNQATGHVKVRSVAVDEIVDIRTNPEDAREPWFYERHFVQKTPSRFAGMVDGGVRKVLYPHWRYDPPVKPATVDGLAVQWDSPIYHVRVGGVGGMRFGVPETYAALDWARAYKSFLEDWATLVRSLSMFAWRATTKGRKVGATAARMSTTLGRDAGETNPPPSTGSVFVGSPDFDFSPIPKTGATTSAEDGRQLRLMVASAMDLPDTILSGDPDMGNLATAKTLDRPTELAMITRQALWADVWRDLLTFVVRSHVKAANGRLSGKVDRDADGIETIRVTGTQGEADTTIDVTFPAILETDTGAEITAIVQAATLDGKATAGTIDDKTLIRLLLVALGVDNADELVDEIADELEVVKDQGAADQQAGFELAAALRDFREARAGATA